MSIFKHYLINIIHRHNINRHEFFYYSLLFLGGCVPVIYVLILAMQSLRLDMRYVCMYVCIVYVCVYLYIYTCMQCFLIICYPLLCISYLSYLALILSYLARNQPVFKNLNPLEDLFKLKMAIYP